VLSIIKELLRTDNKTYLQDGNVQFSRLQRAIEFVDVDFGYDASELVLQNISLTIKRGDDGTVERPVLQINAGRLNRIHDFRIRRKLPIVDLREFEINNAAPWQLSSVRYVSFSTLLCATLPML